MSRITAFTLRKWRAICHFQSRKAGGQSRMNENKSLICQTLTENHENLGLAANPQKSLKVCHYLPSTFKVIAQRPENKQLTKTEKWQHRGSIHASQTPMLLTESLLNREARRRTSLFLGNEMRGPGGISPPRSAWLAADSCGGDTCRGSPACRDSEPHSEHEARSLCRFDPRGRSPHRGERAVPGSYSTQTGAHSRSRERCGHAG